jgi:hypothetical protein
MHSIIIFSKSPREKTILLLNMLHDFTHLSISVSKKNFWILYPPWVINMASFFFLSNCFMFCYGCGMVMFFYVLLWLWYGKVFLCLVMAVVW